MNEKKSVEREINSDTFKKVLIHTHDDDRACSFI